MAAGPDGASAQSDISRRRRARELTRRVDWFEVAFRGELRPAVVNLLNERLAAARASRTATSVELAPGVMLMLSARSVEGRWTLSNADCSVFVDAHASGDFRVAVQARAAMLAVYGPHEALALERVIAGCVLERCTKEQVRRIDLAADYIDFDLRDVDVRRAIVAQRRARVGETTTMKAYQQGIKCTGFDVGRGAMRLRVYDKSEEIELARNDGKRDIELSAWEAAGRKSDEAVTRVELQIRSTVLRELSVGAGVGENGLRDPDTVLANLALGHEALNET